MLAHLLPCNVEAEILAFIATTAGTYATLMFVLTGQLREWCRNVWRRK